ncbi:MAG: bifunctional DNA-binding transcriptional regulator/O6-methylguanine-DNA methyltransferase Ada [Pirellulales bacterium]|nr:bifunctional DNA-binding transcriptional regulator/O6-methylguanine-DNA methyltransferase Ada [Pirellulales bacterium]
MSISLSTATTCKTVTTHDATDAPRYASDDERWQAVLGRERQADERFVYAVTTTGVYCRPSCPSRMPRREHVRFFPSASDAQRAGFRACRRCRPHEPRAPHPLAHVVVRACRSIECAGAPLELETLAAEANMPAGEFRRLFVSLTGVTPTRYAKAVRARRVRSELAAGATVTEACYRAGFGSNGRFYEAAQSMLGMAPGAFRAAGSETTIRFALGECFLGAILVAATDRGVCAIEFGDDPAQLVRDFEDRFPRAHLLGGDRQFEAIVAQVVGFIEQPVDGLSLPLDIQGTAFQQRVWQLLREIPSGEQITYTDVARRLGSARSVRAVASACAANRLAVAIPCHRVVRCDGALAGYRWGIERKAELLERERRQHG